MLKKAVRDEQAQRTAMEVRNADMVEEVVCKTISCPITGKPPRCSSESEKTCTRE